MLQFKRKSAIEDDRPKNKSHKYSDSYLDFGFTFILQNGKEKPQCVICSKVLASESMLPNKLKRHLQTSHPQFVDKPRDFFSRKLNDLEINNLEKQVHFKIHATFIKGFISILPSGA